MSSMLRKKWFRRLLGRRMTVILLLILQVAVMAYLMAGSGAMAEWLGISLSLFSAAVALYIMAESPREEYKMAWVLLILVMPVFGGLLYVFFHLPYGKHGMAGRLERIRAKRRLEYLRPGDHLAEACAMAPQYAPDMIYLQSFAGFPVYKSSSTRYLSPGERKYERLLQALESAEHYIFLEYYIIREGRMWDGILEILKRKAAAGVDVRLIYDDMGCLVYLPTDFCRQMEALGIRCMVFNPFRPFLTARHNNRDHRKIVSIDGKIAFTGGVNIGDEYINAVERFGHWKDAAITVEGEAAWSLTLIFLENWELLTAEHDDAELLWPWGDSPCPVADDGLVQPYADSPMDSENVGKQVYMRMINNARRYLYINTPYLIIDRSVISALCQAAKSGVDVRIVTPHVGDKLLVQTTTRSYYRELTGSGVKVYEYSRGFIHSKTFIADGAEAVIGTVNLDYRSLYLHFECGVWMHGSQAVQELYADFMETLEHCRLIGAEDCRTRLPFRLAQDICRLFAPLM